MSIQTTIHVTGIGDTLRRLAALDRAALRPVVADILADIAHDAAVYPPELPNQRYVRTYRLRDGWLDRAPDVRLAGDTLLGILTNPTPYGPDVMGDTQEPIFQRRWRTVDTISAAWEDRVAARIAAALDQVGAS